MIRVTPACALGLAALLALCAGAPGGASAARDMQPPRIELVGTPKLYVATRAAKGTGRPIAWVVFRTSRHLHDPRPVVVSVAGASGRSFGA